MKKVIISVATCVSILTSSASYAASCASPIEEKALNARALQSYLMVAAISCGQQANYNTFMSKHGKSLAEQGRVLKGYFNRVYAKKANDKLNHFITYLANESSKRSLKIEDSAFCQASEEVFSRLSKNDSSQFFQLASASTYSEVHGIHGCKK
jgi:hypothetical protein